MVYTLGRVINSVHSEFPDVRLSILVEHFDSHRWGLIRAHIPYLAFPESKAVLCKCSSTVFPIPFQ